MKNTIYPRLLLFTLPLIIMSCFDNNEEIKPNDIAKRVEGQYIITGFRYEGDNTIDHLSESEIGDSYISVIKENENQVTVRLILHTESLDFTWSLTSQNVSQTENSEYLYHITPGMTSLNNLHLYITLDGQMKAEFAPYLQPNIKVVYAIK